ncbi:EAL domain-containing protein [Grimontia sp. SpTr1]|uniref:bifunctional diguanylate cyclase/phosphodiesterase n=1 Tax=Grimontia sp. SpTr1 TaxID=2995319 RepID=UPI00248B5FCA|nr:EAL domain-containing protein [Grimontia sp. SpTr1]
MTITNKITLVVAATLILLCTAMAYAEFTINLAFIQQEMQSHANSALQNLSAALVPILETGDLEKSDRFFSAVMSKDALVSQVTLQWIFDGELQNWVNEDALQQKAPVWFSSLGFIEPIWMTTTVRNSWTELATLSIQIPSDSANLALWELLRSFIVSAVTLVAAATLIVRFTLGRMLSPIKTITKEAKRIAKLDFSGHLPSPKASDLSELTHTFNDMSSQLQSLFETLNEEISALRTKYLFDEGSGLPNRSFLTRQTESWLSDGDCGVLMLINLNWLEKIDPSRGTKSLNDCLRSMSKAFGKILPQSNDAMVARLGKSEIAILIPSVHEKQARAYLSEIIRAVNGEIISNGIPTAKGFTIGITENHADDTMSSIMARANTALTQAEATDSVFVFSSTEQEYTQEQLDQTLRTSIEEKLVELTVQPVFSRASHEVQHYEVFAKLQLNDEFIPANKLISDLSRLSLAQHFDRCVITQVISLLEKDKNNGPYSINLTADSTRDPEFLKWLTSTLTINKLKDRLFVEFAEAIACNHPKDCERACRNLSDAGLRYGIDRFGQHLSSVSYLRTLKPAFVKLDHSFIQNAEDDGNLLLLKPMIKMASSLGVEVIASAIEYKQQLARFHEISICAYFGYISPPVPIGSERKSLVKIA